MNMQGIPVIDAGPWYQHLFDSGAIVPTLLIGTVALLLIQFVLGLSYIDTVGFAIPPVAQRVGLAIAAAITLSTLIVSSHFVASYEAWNQTLGALADHYGLESTLGGVRGVPEGDTRWVEDPVTSSDGTVFPRVALVRSGDTISLHFLDGGQMRELEPAEGH